MALQRVDDVRLRDRRSDPHLKLLNKYKEALLCLYGYNYFFLSRQTHDVGKTVDLTSVDVCPTDSSVDVYIIFLILC